MGLSQSLGLEVFLRERCEFCNGNGRKFDIDAGGEVACPYCEGSRYIEFWVSVEELAEYLEKIFADVRE